MMTKECFFLKKQSHFHGDTWWNNEINDQKTYFRYHKSIYSWKSFFRSWTYQSGSYFYQQALEYIRRWLREGTTIKFTIIIIISVTRSSWKIKDWREIKEKKTVSEKLQYLLWKWIRSVFTNTGIFHFHRYL